MSSRTRLARAASEVRFKATGDTWKNQPATSADLSRGVRRKDFAVRTALPVQYTRVKETKFTVCRAKVPYNFYNYNFLLLSIERNGTYAMSSRHS